MAEQFFVARGLFFSSRNIPSSSLAADLEDEENRATQFSVDRSFFSRAKSTASTEFFNFDNLFSPVKNTESSVVAESKNEENGGVSLELSLRLHADPKMKALESSTSSFIIPKPRTILASVARKPEKVSTKLKPSSIVTFKKRKMMGDKPPSCSLAPKAKEQKIVCTREEEEETTRLRLYNDRWKIKKILTKSDVNGLCRLLIPKELMNKQVIPLFNPQQVSDCGSGIGTRVKVFDFDTRTEHELTLKKWKTDSYLLISNWNKEFTNRRNLEMGDEIGLFWNSQTSQLYFSLLKKANT
ncbi:uncharacterized protein LOC132281558 [Cornus florida]|uniref:uncharacterized protein LOC132281558 n=1 Tax=Cornus florida TaxID=4283 RepID=UPI0028A1CCB8|nr:uncharacterized protein LOC132281558 [Cornus florida]